MSHPFDAVEGRYGSVRFHSHEQEIEGRMKMCE
jgi:hypothetical protein